MDDKVNAPPLLGLGGIRPRGDAVPPPIPFPAEEFSKLLSPLGLSPEQTAGVLDCMKETGLRWVIPQMEAAIERTTEVMEQVVKSSIQEVAAGAIHSFGSYAVLCVQQLRIQNEELKMVHQNEVAEWKEYAARLMINLNHQKEIKEAEKKRLEADLELAKRRCLCRSQTPTHKRGSSKRKGDQVEELEQRQIAKKTAPPMVFRQNLTSVMSGLPVVTSQTLIEHLVTCAPPSMKLPPLEVSPPDTDTNDISDQPVSTRLPSSFLEDKAQEVESGVEVAEEVCVTLSEENGPCSAPPELGEIVKPKCSGGTSGEQSVLTSSHVAEDSHSGANDAGDDGNIQASPDSEKTSDEQEPSGQLRKTTSDGHDSSFSTSKQGSEEGDNLQSVLADDVDKADTTAALSLCQLGESLVAPELLKNSNGDSDVSGGCLYADGLDVPPTNRIGCTLMQVTSNESDAKKRNKSAFRSQPDFTGGLSALSEEVKRTSNRRKPSYPSGDEQRPPPQGSPTASEIEAYVSRDHRRISVVAKQLMAMSERKYR